MRTLLTELKCDLCPAVVTDTYELEQLHAGYPRIGNCGHQFYQCWHCNEAVSRALYMTNTGRFTLCKKCGPEVLVACTNVSRCGRKAPANKFEGFLGSHNVIKTHDGQPYCTGCYLAATVTCLACKKMGGSKGLLVRLYDSQFICELPACRARIKTCDACHNTGVDPVDWHTAPAVPHGAERANSMCAPCWKKYGWCPGCKAIIRSRVTGGVPRCSGCRPVLQYNDKAEQRIGYLGVPERHKKLCGTENTVSKPCKCGWDRLFYGVELEVEGASGPARDDLAMKVVELSKGRVICKRDGSLADGGESGFEIVTAPAPFDTQKEIWGPFFDWAPVSGLKAQKTVTCGMHIHVSRAALGNDLNAHWLSIGKIVQFIHEPENRQFIEFMSGRPPGHYQDFMRDKRLFVPTAKPVEWSVQEGAPSDAIKFMTHPGVGKRLTYSPRRDSRSRYTAVNLQNPATVEFRMFKSTLNPTTFWARFEFVVALVKYCLPTVASIRHMKVPFFAEWLSTQRKAYPHLTEYMVKGAFMDPPASRKPIPSPAVPVKAPAPRALSGKARKGLRLKES